MKLKVVISLSTACSKQLLASLYSERVIIYFIKVFWVFFDKISHLTASSPRNLDPDSPFFFLSKSLQTVKISLNVFIRDNKNVVLVEFTHKDSLTS